MRLSVNLDELERGLTHFTEGYADGRFPRFMFPPSQTLPTAAVDMKAVLRRTLISLLSIIACFAASIPLFLTAIVVTVLSHYRHQIHHIQWRLLKLLYGIALDIFLRPLSANAVCFHHPGVWCAWIRLATPPAVGLEPPRGSPEL